MFASLSKVTSRSNLMALAEKENTSSCIVSYKLVTHESMISQVLLGSQGEGQFSRGKKENISSNHRQNLP
jgi:hypothetical protein